MSPGLFSGENMQANIHQDSIGTSSVLEPGDAEECTPSEAMGLPVTWQSPQSWPVLLRPKATETVICRLPDNEAPAQPRNAEPPLVRLTKQYIQDNYPENFSLQRVAAALCADAFHLGELVGQTTGMDFSDYVTSIRVEKAKNLLLNPNYCLIEIASVLGFESQGQFNDAFKGMVGEPPHAYCMRLPARVCSIAQEA
jgi:AraC-like DNA-binding protein